MSRLIFRDVMQIGSSAPYWEQIDDLTLDAPLPRILYRMLRQSHRLWIFAPFPRTDKNILLAFCDHTDVMESQSLRTLLHPRYYSLSRFRRLLTRLLVCIEGELSRTD